MSGHGIDRASLDDARRSTPYRRLVLLSERPDAPDLARIRAHEALALVDVDVRAVPGRDLAACLRAAQTVLAVHARDRVRVHLGGGGNLLASALLLAALDAGRDAFHRHPRGTTRIPVPSAVPLVDLLGHGERVTLAALPARGEAAVAGLAAAGLAADALKDALRKLRARGLVCADAERASLTPTGAAYRTHLARGAASLRP